MRILFDSRQTQYKTPFGTLRTGECCVLQIRIPTEVGASGVRLMLEDSEHAVCAELPFSFVSRGEDGYELWRLEFTRQETGLHFYWFRIDKRGGSFRLFRQGSDTNMEAGEKWQLSVIPADFTVPDFAPGAVMYQIFPDRFARSGSCDLTLSSSRSGCTKAPMSCRSTAPMRTVRCGTTTFSAEILRAFAKSCRICRSWASAFST